MVIIWLIMGNNNLVGWFFPTPLKNDGVKVSWDDEIPNMMGKKMFQMFQTTNQPKKVWHSTNSAQKLYISLP